MSCPLCRAAARPFHDDTARRWPYLRCPGCGLVFREPSTFWPAEKEKARYQTHRNTAEDAGYAAFLEPAAQAVRRRVPPGAAGLDFGCGPGPVLAQRLRGAGYPAEVYDPHFAPNESVLRRTYDFVTCTETAEHFHEPGREFERLSGLLKPGGWLIVMTRVLEAGEDFAKWWYREDPTHVCFYGPGTLAWLAARHGWRLERPAPTLACFQSP